MTIVSLFLCAVVLYPPIWPLSGLHGGKTGCGRGWRDRSKVSRRWFNLSNPGHTGIKPLWWPIIHNRLCYNANVRESRENTFTFCMQSLSQKDFRSKLQAFHNNCHLSFAVFFGCNPFNIPQKYSQNFYFHLFILNVFSNHQKHVLLRRGKILYKKENF